VHVVGSRGEVHVVVLRVARCLLVGAVSGMVGRWCARARQAQGAATGRQAQGAATGRRPQTQRRSALSKRAHMHSGCT
jgi:hypothetical protein